MFARYVRAGHESTFSRAISLPVFPQDTVCRTRWWSRSVTRVTLLWSQQEQTSDSRILSSYSTTPLKASCVSFKENGPASLPPFQVFVSESWGTAAVEWTAVYSTETWHSFGLSSNTISGESSYVFLVISLLSPSGMCSLGSL